MKHIKWIRSIHLLREGELTTEEEQSLNSHLAECKHCSAVYEQVQLDWVKVVGEVSAEPIMHHPHKISKNVLLTIEQGNHQTMRQQSDTRLESVPFIISPNFRLSLQAACLVLLSIFFIEQFEVTTSVQELEVQLQSQVSQPRYARIQVIPPMFRARLLDIARFQLEKRGIQSNQIERLINTLETKPSHKEFRRTGRLDIGTLERWLFAQWGKTKIKAMNANWRQP